MYIQTAAADLKGEVRRWQVLSSACFLLMSQGQASDGAIGGKSTELALQMQLQDRLLTAVSSRTSAPYENSGAAHSGSLTPASGGQIARSSQLRDWCLDFSFSEDVSFIALLHKEG